MTEKKNPNRLPLDTMRFFSKHRRLKILLMIRNWCSVRATSIDLNRQQIPIVKYQSLVYRCTHDNVVRLIRSQPVWIRAVSLSQTRIIFQLYLFSTFLPILAQAAATYEKTRHTGTEHSHCEWKAQAKSLSKAKLVRLHSESESE